MECGDPVSAFKRCPTERVQRCYTKSHHIVEALPVHPATVSRVPPRAGHVAVSKRGSRGASTWSRDTMCWIFARTETGGTRRSTWRGHPCLRRCARSETGGTRRSTWRGHPCLRRCCSIGNGRDAPFYEKSHHIVEALPVQPQLKPHEASPTPRRHCGKGSQREVRVSLRPKDTASGQPSVEFIVL